MQRDLCLWRHTITVASLHSCLSRDMDALDCGGRARNSDGFVCLHQIPLKKYQFQAMAKKQVSKRSHPF